jgi:hypothetical protein
VSLPHELCCFLLWNSCQQHWPHACIRSKCGSLIIFFTRTCKWCSSKNVSI